MKVFLIRHTPTVAERGVVYGISDLDIAQPFEPLFTEIGDFIWGGKPASNPDPINGSGQKTSGSTDNQSHPNTENSPKTRENGYVFFSSPLIRCRKMAQYMAETYHRPVKPVIYDDRLKEIDFGRWELQRWSELPESEVNAWMEDFVDAAPPDGESFASVMERSVAFWEEHVMPLCAEPLNVLPGEVSTSSVKTTADEEPIVCIFGHGGVLRSILCHVIGLEMKHAFKLILRHGSITQLEVNKDMRRTRLVHLSHGGVDHSY